MEFYQKNCIINANESITCMKKYLYTMARELISQDLSGMSCLWSFNLQAMNRVNALATGTTF